MDSIQGSLSNNRLSKNEARQVLRRIINFEIPVSELIDNLDSGNYWLLFNTFWILRDLSREAKQIIFPYQQQIYDCMIKNSTDEGVVRNGISIFEDQEISEKLEDAIFDFCFEKLTNNSSAVAIKAFSMTVCYKIALNYPDLFTELKIVIEDNMNSLGQVSPAIISRGRKILKLIDRHSNRWYP